MAAIAEFQGIIQDDPQFYVAYLSLSNSLHELKRYSEAKTILEDAIRVFEAHGRNAAWAHINLARLYEKLAENELARKEYQVSLELDTDEIWFYSYYAQFLEARSEKDAALLTYLAMARVAEENGWNIGWAYSSLANFYRQMGMLEEALKSYQKAVGDQPENALLRSFLAETYFGLGEADAAVAEYEAALALEEDVYFVFASYAGVLFQMGNLDRAAEMYRKSLELRPVDYAVLLNLGQVYQQQGKISDARQVYQTVLSYADRFPAEVIQIAAQRLAELGEP